MSAHVENNLSEQKRLLAAGVILLGGLVLIWYVVLRPAYVRQFIEIDIPSEATNTKYALRNTLHLFFEESVYLRFELPPDALPDFLDSMCFDDTDLHRDYSPFRTDTFEPGWWTPETAAVFEGGQCYDDRGKGYDILIDETTPLLYTIYLTVIAL